MTRRAEGGKRKYVARKAEGTVRKFAVRKIKTGTIEAEGTGRKYVARRLKIGGTLERDLDEVADAWERAERGEEVSHRVISFEDMETFQRTLTRARLRLFRHLQK